jgi:putative aminopeptidase FrvX
VSDRWLAIAEDLLANPTAPLMEDLPAAHVEAFARERGLAHGRDAAGNVLVRAGDGGGRPLVLVAHLDHPGFHVDDADGEVAALSFHGGLLAEHAAPGSPLAFFRRGEREPVGRGALVAADADKGRLTGGSAEVLEGDAPPGGFAMWDFPAWSVADGLVTARVCDDLLGAAAILATLDEVGECPVWGLFTRGEEIGFLGAIEAIRLGTVPAGSAVLSLECSPALPSAPQGGGVIVRVGDRMSIFEPTLTAALAAAAEGVAAGDATFRWQRRLMDGGACEATAFCASGYRASGVAVPLGGYHNAGGGAVAPETVLVDDWLAEVRLLIALAREPSLLDPDTTEPPQWLIERGAAARDLLAGGLPEPEVDGA